MKEQYKILFSGQLRLDVTPQQAIDGFAAKFGVTTDKAQALINSGGKVVVKKGLTRHQAEKYHQALEEVGMIVSLASMQSRAQPGSSLSLEPNDDQPLKSNHEAAAASEKICPKCGSNQIENNSCLDCGIVLSDDAALPADLKKSSVSIPLSNQTINSEAANPYAAPTADLTPDTELDEMSGPDSVPISHGWAWLAGGFWYFKRNPLAWMAAIVIFILLSIGLQLIPFLGGLLLTLLQPVITAGFMLGIQEQELERDFRVSHIFAGFSNKNMGQLLLVGLLYLIGLFLILFGIVLTIGGTLAATGGLEGDPDMLTNIAGSSSVFIVMLLGVAFSIPLFMAYWFAPALIALDGLSAINAMKLSFFGCFKNILPFLIYGIAAVLLIIVGTIPFLLGLLVVIPMLIASAYVSYRDIFYG